MPLTSDTFYAIKTIEYSLTINPYGINACKIIYGE